MRNVTCFGPASVPAPGDQNAAITKAAATKVHSPAVLAIYAHWASHRGPQGFALRRDIDPLAMGGRNLPHVVLIDLLETGDLLYRLVGGHVREYVGYDFTGWKISKYYDGKPDDGSPEDYHQAIRLCRPVHSVGNLIEEGRSYVSYERLAMPLSHDGERVQQLLCGFEFRRDSRRGEVPRQVTVFS